MKLDNSTSGILIRTYFFGAILLVVFYAFIFFFGTSETEDTNSMKRLAIVGEYYIDKYKDQSAKSIVVDPLLTVYTNYSALPKLLQMELDRKWVGSTTFHFGDKEVEYNVLAKAFTEGGKQKVIYAVEDIEAIELNDKEVIILMSTVLGGGILMLILASAYIVNSAKRISRPITELSEQLNKDEEFGSINVEGNLSDEMQKMESAINIYRAKIAAAFEREKSFTRYVSHELRTPMTVVKGSISVLSKLPDKKVQKQVALLRDSIDEMESLTKTFLFLARQHTKSDSVIIDKELIEETVRKFQPLIDANNTKVNIELLHSFELNACHQLFSAAIGNLLQNALNCNQGSVISIFASKEEIKIIDQGTGLSTEYKRSDGFGLGLKIVSDICDKYNWQFSLSDNINQGCTATIKFKYSD